ncbi:hypothetical protein IWQ60_005326 [Tieghemiomyces parasiticus]|uniref:Uncharacterized protein n=1 Tax=Tieghemiomyces parasiticus TaxID=78921 RepID=A0A9W8A9W0_9FUNG|nr:hypothetical protein IWQ60_005326 [Tieghemiomyces parasiticus]
MLARFALVSLLAGLGVSESIFAWPASRPDVSGPSATTPGLNPLSNTRDACPSKIQLLMTQTADKVDMTRFLEITHEMHGKVLDDECIRKVMSLLPLALDSQRSSEYQHLSKAGKEFLAETFRFDYDLCYGYDSRGDIDDIDIRLAPLSHSDQTSSATAAAMWHYVNVEVTRAATEIRTIDFRGLSLHQKYSFSPLLALAWEGNMDTVVGLRDRLVTYSREPDFMRSLLQHRHQHRLDVYDASRREGSGTDRVPLALQPPEDNFSTTDLAIILTLASAGHFDQLQRYTELLHPPSSPVVPAVQPQVEDPAGGELNNQMAVAQEQPLPAPDNQAVEGQAGAGDAAEEYQGDMEFATLAYLATVELKGTLADNEFYNRADIRLLLLEDAWNCAAKYQFSDHTRAHLRDEIAPLFSDGEVPLANEEACSYNFFAEGIVYDFATGDLGFRVDPGLLTLAEATVGGIQQQGDDNPPTGHPSNMVQMVIDRLEGLQINRPETPQPSGEISANIENAGTAGSSSTTPVTDFASHLGSRASQLEMNVVRNADHNDPSSQGSDHTDREVHMDLLPIDRASNDELGRDFYAGPATERTEEELSLTNSSGSDDDRDNDAVPTRAVRVDFRNRSSASLAQTRQGQYPNADTTDAERVPETDSDSDDDAVPTRAVRSDLGNRSSASVPAAGQAAQTERGRRPNTVTTNVESVPATDLSDSDDDMAPTRGLLVNFTEPEIELMLASGEKAQNYRTKK